MKSRRHVRNCIKDFTNHCKMCGLCLTKRVYGYSISGVKSGTLCETCFNESGEIEKADFVYQIDLSEATSYGRI